MCELELSKDFLDKIESAQTLKTKNIAALKLKFCTL